MTQDSSKEFLLASFKESDFETIKPFPHPTQMSVMPVVAYRGREIRPLGTCFAISNLGIVLTARHVVDEAFEISGWRSSTDLTPNTEWTVAALYASDQPNKDNPEHLTGGLLPVGRVWMSGDIDIAAMWLRLPVNTDTGKKLRMPAMQLHAGIPRNGTQCTGLGYHSMKWNTENDGPNTHSVFQSYSASRGKIEEAHFPNRDRSQLHFPCFRTTARFDSGMSGGPILGEEGVIGVICSSLGSPDGGGHISYGSLIAPALVLQVDYKDEEENVVKGFLHDFVEKKNILINPPLSANAVRRIADGISIEIEPGKTVSNKL